MAKFSDDRANVREVLISLMDMLDSENDYESDIKDAIGDLLQQLQALNNDFFNSVGSYSDVLSDARIYRLMLAKGGRR
ncbi:hypothetical protein WOSG25_041610 [Weissella oryzae SG25]|uniref:Uncharacterized protein n=1 Tax=Weissella oryzae (strain DSM 25784 / JCM 18191 / LMG 30913 / SG25) TaxID=1329250 RepID=A0A069CSB9_WEIOS|nr:hypothetical protein [Weissella oryzae]GAK30720.1 hypothetical protein WOSG25_041610 [Weissella oryzae SG25]